jgi:hypothetical protein
MSSTITAAARACPTARNTNASVSSAHETPADHRTANPCRRSAGASAAAYRSGHLRRRPDVIAQASLKTRAVRAAHPTTAHHTPAERARPNRRYGGRLTLLSRRLGMPSRGRAGDRLLVENAVLRQVNDHGLPAQLEGRARRWIADPRCAPAHAANDRGRARSGRQGHHDLRG